MKLKGSRCDGTSQDPWLWSGPGSTGGGWFGRSINTPDAPASDFRLPLVERNGSRHCGSALAQIRLPSPLAAPRASNAAPTSQRMSAPVPTTLGDHGQRLPSRCYGATVREFLRAAEGILLNGGCLIKVGIQQLVHILECVFCRNSLRRVGNSTPDFSVQFIRCPCQTLIGIKGL